MSLNKVMLIGNVGQDPEVKYIDSGICTARISLATSTPAYTLQNGTHVPERTEWHTVYLWRRLAEVAERYIHKGDKLYVEGELRYRSYTDKKGATHKAVEIWGSNIEMLSPRPQTTGTPAPATPTPANPANPFPPSNNSNGKPLNKPTDDLPF